MPGWLIVGLAVFVLLIVYSIWRGAVRLKRAEFIRTFSLPQGLYDKLRARRPQLSLRDCSLVGRALRQFFLAYLNSGRRFVAMPSQAADDLWHEFILYTRDYQRFCGQAFGGFLHHTPAVVLGSGKQTNEGLRRVWWHACKDENIDPKKALRLPLIFALDAKLNIDGGFRYAPDCRRLAPDAQAGTHCGGDFSSISIDGTLDGFGDGSSDGGDGGGGCGGGD